MSASIYRCKRIGRSRDETNFEIFSDALHRAGALLDCAAPSLSHCYLALELPAQAGTIGLVATMAWQPRDWPNFRYEIFAEGSGGYLPSRCPIRILDRLTPVDELEDFDARERRLAGRWREACRTHHARRASLPRVSRGDWVRFPRRINFRGGPELGPFRFEQGSTFVSRGSGSLVRIHNWRDLDYEILPAPSEDEKAAAVSPLEDLLGKAIDLGGSK